MKFQAAIYATCIILIIFISPEIRAQEWISCGLNNKSILCISVNPVEKDKIYVGVEDEGIYWSSDGGESWSHSWGDESVNSIAINRFDTRNIYAGKKNEILISKNGGNHFTTLSRFEDITVNSIVFDETSTKIIILGTTSGVYRSIDGGMKFQNAGLSDQEVTSITVDNKNAKPIIYCATMGAGVYESANNGLSWQPIITGLFEYDLNIYFILCNYFFPTELILGTLESGIFISRDNLISEDNPETEIWTKVETELASNQGYTITQSLDYKTKKILLFATNFSSKIIKSKDFGKNWENLDFPITDTRILSLFATNIFPSTLYVGTTNGIYKLKEQEN